MKGQILHEGRGRMRVHLIIGSLSMEQADSLEAYLNSFSSIEHASFDERTNNVVIYYSCLRSELIRILSEMKVSAFSSLPPISTGREITRHFERKVLVHVLKRTMLPLFLPSIMRPIIIFSKSASIIYKGLLSLRSKRLQVAFLDAVAVMLSLLRHDFSTAGSIMFLLGLSEILEEWTRKKSVDDLARSMSLNIDMVWQVLEDGRETLVPIHEVHAGNCIIVRAGSMIPLDGCVVEGEVEVNQSSMTGESLPVHKSVGGYVYAGTVVDNGECIIKVQNESGAGRYDRIVKMIEETEQMKSETENSAVKLSDRLVPFSLLGSMVTYLLTHNPMKALSFLMVDFSCALKLAIPIAVLSAMRECSNHHISVKGGRYLETFADVDTIVFDKTGTLTLSQPTLHEVIPFGGHDIKEVLKLAACLEEHYPHSIANAVVKAAELAGLKHEEQHSKVEYVVAHGIVSSIDGKRILIGSRHFVFEDEKCKILEEDLALYEQLPQEYSHLYLAIGGELAAVLLIEDPLREEASRVIDQLHQLGVKRCVMMTGDSYKTANAIAKKLQLDEFKAEVLPEDKASYIREARMDNHKLVMIGDGVNDSLALSEADVGIAMSDGAAIAKEISDITIGGENLESLITLRNISNQLMRRIEFDYRFILGFNSLLIFLGLSGVMSPSLMAYLHNISTLGISAKNMTNLLKK